MKYEMEELLPIVRTLAEKYTAYESTSITYERAEQLMEAVLYCVRELEQSGDTSVVAGERISPQKAYEIGAAYVEAKTRAALQLYHEILPGFCDYENACLYDTFVKGIPEFFKWYDVRFAPQDTILTLDYPVLRELSGYTGVDRVYEWLRCICLEQKFLHLFLEDEVIRVWERENRQYREMPENLCEAVLGALTVCALMGKTLTEFASEQVDLKRLQEILRQLDRAEICRQSKRAVEVRARERGEDGEKMVAYLSGTMNGIALRLKIAAEHGQLYVPV